MINANGIDLSTTLGLKPLSLQQKKVKNDYLSANLLILDNEEHK